MIGKAQRPEEEAETLKMLESHTLRGSPRGKSCSLNIWEVGLKKGFFPLKILEMFACKRNYFVLQEKLQFCLSERV